MGVLDALLSGRAGEVLEEGFKGAAREIKRLPDGHFAPKGTGAVLTAGEKVAVPHREKPGEMVPGEVTAVSGGKATVKLSSGPDAGKPFEVRAKAPPKGAGVPRGTARKRKLTEQELPKRVGRGRWSAQAERTTADLLSGRVADTENAHRETKADGSLGAYSAERTELHGRIAGLLMRHAQEHPDDARAIFLAGGPASGKSSLISSGNLTLPGDHVDVNPDIVRTMLPEYSRLVAAGDQQAAAKTHEEASHVSKLVMNLALERKHHVLVDGVGGGAPGKFAGKIEATRAAGHTPEVHYVSIPTEVAVDRATKRAQRSGRHVPTGYLRSSHAEVSERFLNDVQKLPVHVRVFDNQGKAPVLAAEKSADERAMKVRNRKAYDAFTKKARRDAGQEV